MHFLFVDQILALVPRKRALGVKHVTAHDVYLHQGADGKASILPCIVGEALGQLGAWNVMQDNGFTKRPVAGVVGEVNVLGQAYVGDTIVLEAIIDHLDDQAVHYHCEASVNGKPIVQLKDALGPFLPMEDFIDPNVVANQFEMINRPAEIPASIDAVATAMPVTIEPVKFDRVSFNAQEKTITAQKNVSILAPYFVDHFPRKPVLPLSVLLQCKVDLGFDFISKLETNRINPTDYTVKVRRIKMNAFVQPGNIVTTTAKVKQHSGNVYVFIYRSEVAGRRVGITEIEYSPLS